MATDTNILETTEGSQPYGIVFQSMAKASMGNGVLGRSTGNTSLKVTQRGAGANMSVDVAAGSCIINGALYTEAGVTNLAVSAAHASLDRRDLVVYDRTAGNPAIVTGTPSATADPPNVSDINDIHIAVVFVALGVTSITNSDIIDIRGYSFQPYTTASDTLRISNDTERTMTGASYVKVKEILLNDGGLYIARVKFDTKDSDAIGAVRVYLNGAPIGTEQANTFIYATKTEDITINGGGGDLLQVYCTASSGGATGYVKNFRIYYDYSWPTVSTTNQDP